MSHVRISHSQLLSAERSGKIDLHDQYLPVVPAEIWDLKGIHSVDLSGNRFTELPGHIAKLKTVQTLNLEGNSALTLLPPELSLLTQLRYISLFDCPKLPRPILDAYNRAKSAPVRMGENFRDAKPILEAIKLLYISQKQQINTDRPIVADPSSYSGSARAYSSAYVPQTTVGSAHSTPSPYGDPTYEDEQPVEFLDGEDEPFDDPAEEAEYQQYRAAKLRELYGTSAGLSQPSHAPTASPAFDERQREIDALEREYEALRRDNEERLRRMTMQTHAQSTHAADNAAGYPAHGNATPVPVLPLSSLRPCDKFDQRAQQYNAAPGHYGSGYHDAPHDVHHGDYRSDCDDGYVSTGGVAAGQDACAVSHAYGNQCPDDRTAAASAQLPSRPPSRFGATPSVALTAPFAVGSGAANDVAHPSSAAQPSRGSGRGTVNGETYVNVNLQPRPLPFATHENTQPLHYPAGGTAGPAASRAGARRSSTPIPHTDFSAMREVPAAGSARPVYGAPSTAVRAQPVLNSRSAMLANMRSDIFHATDRPTQATTGVAAAGGSPSRFAAANGHRARQDHDIFNAHGTAGAVASSGGPRAGMFASDGSLQQPRMRNARHDHDIFSGHPAPASRGGAPARARVNANSESHANIIAHNEHRPSDRDAYAPYHSGDTSFLAHRPHTPSRAPAPHTHHSHLQQRGGAIAAVLGVGDAAEVDACIRVSGGSGMGVSGQGMRRTSAMHNQSHLTTGAQGFTVARDEDTLAQYRPLKETRPPSARLQSTLGQQQRRGHDIFGSDVPAQEHARAGAGAGTGDDMNGYVREVLDSAMSVQRPDSYATTGGAALSFHDALGDSDSVPGAHFSLSNPLYEPQQDPTHPLTARETAHSFGAEAASVGPSTSRPNSARRGIMSSYDYQFMHALHNDEQLRGAGEGPTYNIAGARALNSQPNYKQVNEQTASTNHIFAGGAINNAAGNQSDNLTRVAPVSTEDFNRRVRQSSAQDLARRNRSSNIF